MPSSGAPTARPSGSRNSATATRTRETRTGPIASEEITAAEAATTPPPPVIPGMLVPFTSQRRATSGEITVVEAPVSSANWNGCRPPRSEAG